MNVKFVSELWTCCRKTKLGRLTKTFGKRYALSWREVKEKHFLLKDWPWSGKFWIWDLFHPTDDTIFLACPHIASNFVLFLFFHNFVNTGRCHHNISNFITWVTHVVLNGSAEFKNHACEQLISDVNDLEKQYPAQSHPSQASCLQRCDLENPTPSGAACLCVSRLILITPELLWTFKSNALLLSSSHRRRDCSFTSDWDLVFEFGKPSRSITVC